MSTTNPIWHGRWTACLYFDELKGFRDVGVNLYREDMPLDVAINILLESGSDVPPYDSDGRLAYEITYVESTFDNVQRGMMAKFFARHSDGVHLRFYPAEVPMIDPEHRNHGVAGPQAFDYSPVRGGIFEFEKEDDYDLPFLVHGIFNINPDFHEWVGDRLEGTE